MKVEFEDLIPPGKNGLRSFIEERNRSTSDRDKVVPIANLAKLTERFKRIGVIATTDLDQGHQTPQVQRVKAYLMVAPKRLITLVVTMNSTSILDYTLSHLRQASIMKTWTMQDHPKSK